MKERKHRVRAILLLTAIVSLAAQLAFRTILPAGASLAGANGLSAALGLAHGRGMTIAVSEGMAIKRSLPPDREITTVFAPDEERLPLIEPLPGPVLLFYLLSLTGLPFTLNTVSLVNMLILALGAVALGDEIARRRVWPGILAAVTLAGFVPLYRMTIVAGYDMYEFLCLIAAVVFLLKFERTGRLRWLILNAVFVGLGLWMRSYFILFAVSHAVIVTILLVRGGRPNIRVFVGRILAWIAPVVILAALMISVRDSGSTGTLLTRGAFWHMFWMGVGQFDNEEVDGFTDWDSCELARRLGHPIPCDSSYEDPRQPYLFQYDRSYNALLRGRAEDWVADHPGRLTANAVGRMLWLLVPGLMDSSRIGASPIGQIVAVILSIMLLMFAVAGFVSLHRALPGVLVILLGTYAALLPLTPYYLNAKVVAIAYFCVLAVASAGLVEVWRRGQRFLR